MAKHSLQSFIKRANVEARNRRRPASSAYLLLLMLQRHEEAGALLTQYGVHEADLLRALKAEFEESRRTIDVCVERASRLADDADDSRGELYLLWAFLRDGGSAARSCLAAMGVDLDCLQAALDGELGLSSKISTRTSSRRASEIAPIDAISSSPQAKRNRRKPVQGSRAARAPIHPKRQAVAPKPDAASPQHDATSPEHHAAQGMPLSLAEEKSTATADAVPPTAVPRMRVNVSPTSARTASAPESAAAAHELDPGRFPILAGVGRNLTQLAADGHLDPVIGREIEIEQILDILARRRANNPILVGPPGVGKTAVVEGLAQHLLSCLGDKPVDSLPLLIELSAGALVSGTGVRGALADRMRALRAEVHDSPRAVLLFLDEIHCIVGTGEGADDLGNELKAALARGELPCIGATTQAEYVRHIERDPALERRFTQVEIAEPCEDVARSVLAGVAPKYELHHGVTFADDALDAAVQLTSRYVVGRHLPDKAIAVIDLAAARVRRRGGKTVDRGAIASVVSEQSGVPEERLLMQDGERLLALEDHLKTHIVGHSEPIARIADVIRKSAAGLRGNRPLGSFLLLGHTGVGKTEVAKAVAQALYPEGALCRFDMSELSEPHSLARLLGAPPGYVGHEHGGQLTEAVRRRPYQLLLLDEIEKAHIDVLMALLPLLDEGRLTDGRGRTVDFTHTVIFMTSNLGVAPRDAASIGFDDAGGSGSQPTDPSGEAAKAISRVRARLPPELFNRIDEPLYFAPLSRSEVLEIASLMVASLSSRLSSERGIELLMHDSALEALIQAGGYDPELGARPMRRTIGRLIESPLASSILAGDVRPGPIELRGEADRIIFCPMAAEAAE